MRSLERQPQFVTRRNNQRLRARNLSAVGVVTDIWTVRPDCPTSRQRPYPQIRRTASPHGAPGQVMVTTRSSLNSPKRFSHGFHERRIRSPRTLHMDSTPDVFNQRWKGPLRHRGNPPQIHGISFELPGAAIQRQTWRCSGKGRFCMLPPDGRFPGKLYYTWEHFLGSSRGQVQRMAEPLARGADQARRAIDEEAEGA